MADVNFSTNLRRLLMFEHKTVTEAALMLGVTGATVSHWLHGKRFPGAEALVAIDTLYRVSPRELDLDPIEFAQCLADPERIKYAAVAVSARKEALTFGTTQAASSIEDIDNDSLAQLAKELRATQGEYVLRLREVSDEAPRDH